MGYGTCKSKEMAYELFLRNHSTTKTHSHFSFLRVILIIKISEREDKTLFNVYNHCEEDKDEEELVNIR